MDNVCYGHAWPQQCWKSCANGSNIVALRSGDHEKKRVVGQQCCVRLQRALKFEFEASERAALSRNQFFESAFTTGIEKTSAQ